VPALICGSIAYDTIMVFPDRFKNHILPDQIHVLNVSFLVTRHAPGISALRRQYRLQPEIAGREPLIMATVGEDSLPYAQHLDHEELARTHLPPGA